jgi:uncharacterized protein (TIGR02145 family)
MKKIFVVLSMVAFLAACSGEGGNSTNPSDDESATLSSADGQGSSSSTKKSTDSSDSNCEECNDKAISSDSNAESNGSSRSSSSEQNVASSSSEKLSETSSSSADKVASSSNSEFLATPCKTETEDNCEYGTVLDDRNGQVYKTVKIGDQWWMAENLNYAYIGVSYNCDGYTSDSTSWCYDNNASNCTKYGRLYTWAAAMDSAGTWSANGKGCGYGTDCSPTDAVRGICPSGWHLPSNDEWNALFTAVGGQSNAGKVLKSQTGWNNNGNGTDTYGFSALPAGRRNYHGNFDYDGYYAYFWSATEDGIYFAYYMSLGYDYESADLYYYHNFNGFSVRCLKD